MSEPYRSDVDDVFEMALDLLCVAGFDGYLKRVNPAWTRTLGWTAEELLARPSIELVHPDDRDGVLAARRRLADGAPLVGLVNRYRCKDGSYRWLEWRSVAHVDRGVVYAAARDVTEQRAAERAYREAREANAALQRQVVLADRLASVGTLAAGVAHEINNPLAYVAANLELLDEQLAAAGAPDGWRELVGEARHGAERIRTIVRNLGAFSRAGEERRAPLDLRPVLERAIELTSNQIRHRARLVTDFAPTPRVLGDEARLGQVFLDLLVNAAQAIEEGGGEANEIRVVTATDAAGRAVVEVHDTGPGLPDDVRDRVFDPFFTTKPIGVGTGLGLSACHGIITALGGEITIANRAGGGAVVQVVLPPVEADHPPPSPPRSAAAPRRAVLVVDDDRLVGRTLARLLREHDVTVVGSAPEALALVDGGAVFDAILTDVMMPGVSGIELYEQLARTRPDAAARVVFVTGGAFTPGAADFLAGVPNRCLEKPFDAAAVRAAVAEAAQSSSASRRR